MSVIERGLIKAINSGRCFAFIGAGPSCEIGIPSWQKLAKHVLDALKDKIDISEGQKLIVTKQYPKFFSLVEKKIGLSALLNLTKSQIAGTYPLGQIYQFITRWPFQGYLTTNFDDELLRHLKEQGETFVIRKNSQDDLRVLHSDAKQVIFKIHGDYDVPTDIVLTEEQYNDFRKSTVREYWRDTMLSFLKMSNVVLIGYSASDPDFKDQLARLKNIAAPDHPIYMFAADLDVNQIDEYFKNSIRVISYNNGDGTHSELRRTLKRYSSFITNRRSPFIGLEPVDTKTATLASSLYLFTNLRLIEDNSSVISSTYAALILNILAEFGQGKTVSIDTLIDKAKNKSLSMSGVDPKAMETSINHLYSLGLINVINGFSQVVLNPKGAAVLAKASATQKLVEEKFISFCINYLRRDYPQLNGDQANTIAETLKLGIIKAFDNRGIEIARFTFTDVPLNVSDATDILDVVNHYSSQLNKVDEKTAFADLMIEILLKPHDSAKEYLGSLCHGYFAYHALGLDPTCSAERLDIAKKTAWILDSSIILPLLAIDCLNHNWAIDMLQRMNNLGLKYTTTERLFNEVLSHARWAIVNFIEVPTDSRALLEAANATAGYKQNLFIDGFVKWSAIQALPNLDKYMIQCLGDNYRKELNESIREKLGAFGIEIKDFASWPFFQKELWAKRDEMSAEIAKSRNLKGTYTGESQCEAEAEAVIICDKQLAVFISQSSFLNRFSTNNKTISWKPAALYQFLTFFSSIPADVDILCQCMNQDFFAMGFDIVNREAIINFASGSIHQSRMSLEKERENYVRVLGEPRVKELEEGYDKTPDEYKPFYSIQYATYVINQQQRQLESANKRIQASESTHELTTKERREYQRLKAKAAEKTQKQKKSKRRAQSRGKKQKKK